MNIVPSIILTIIRHGQTLGNENRIVEGITDTPLNDNGRTQSKYAGEWLKNQTFDFVLTSDLSRAKETTSLILKENVNFQMKEGNYAELDLLRERNFGVLEGTSIEEYKTIAEKQGVHWYTFSPEGAETLDDVKHRSIEFVKMVSGINSHSAANIPKVLVVTHGYVISQLVRHIYRETKSPGVPSDVLKNPWTSYHTNTAITTFEIMVDTRTLQLRSANCPLFKSIEHLPH